MNNPNVLPSHKAAVVEVLDPDAYAAGAVNSGWIAMTDFEAIMAVIMAGTLGAAATLDAKLQQATSAAGAGAKDITGKAITQLVKATDDDKQAIINLRADEMDVTNGFTHVRLVMTVGVAASDAGAIVLGLNEHYGPANARDLASVAEIVA